MPDPVKIGYLDRFIAWLSPNWAKSRVRARVLARHYEAASSGRRTENRTRLLTDANAAAPGATLAHLRAQARDLVRNNPWARRGLRRITTSVVGWGIRPKANGRGAAKAQALWRQWGETTQCDAAGRLTFYGLQRLVMRTVVESGEVLVRRRRRLPADDLAVPMQLQVLEPDYIDTGKEGKLEGGGEIVQGIEFDAIGRRVAYWLFDQHPGGRGHTMPVSKRVPADGILHIYDQERPGQIRGVSWFASVDIRLREFDEYEDATLVKQKIASFLAAFVTDLDGTGVALGEAGTDRATGQATDTFEPGTILNLPAGKTVQFSNPPQANDHQSFTATSLRAVAAGIGVTYEDLCGDYSQVNYSSARMARLAFTADVHDWRENTLIPQFCVPVWMWMLETMIAAGESVALEPATWTPPPAQMLDPDKEGLAMSRNVRAGVMTHSEMVREQGYDPDEFWKEYAAGLKKLDELKIVLDSDARKMTQAGQLQQVAGDIDGKSRKPPGGADKSDDESESNDKPKDDGEADTMPKDKKQPAASSGEVKVFAYQQPFMKAREIRERIGLPGDVKDGDLFALEFIAKHGGSSDDDSVDVDVSDEE